MSALSEVLRQKAAEYLMKNGHVPPKARTKGHGGGFRRKDNEELSKHPGSSRSRVIDLLRAVAAQHTGAEVASDTTESRLGQLGTRSGKVVIVRKHRS